MTFRSPPGDWLGWRCPGQGDGMRRASKMSKSYGVLFTLPETNSEFTPKNGWLEYYFPIGEAYFQALC